MEDRFSEGIVGLQGATKRPGTFLSPILTAQQAGRHFASQKPMELNPCIGFQSPSSRNVPRGRSFSFPLSP